MDPRHRRRVRCRRSWPGCVTLALDRSPCRSDPRKPPGRGGHGEAGRGHEPPGQPMMREELARRRSSDHGHEDGNAERLTEGAERDVHGGPGGEAVGGQAGDGSRREQRQHHGDADSRQEDVG